MTGEPGSWEPLPEKVNLLVVVLTYSRQVGGDVFSYCCRVGPELANHPRIENVEIAYTQGYPTDRCRNAAVKGAQQRNFDFLLMLDDDQVPDMFLGHDKAAKPFLTTALDFALAHDGPCCVGAPYCSGPPAQEVVVMKNREYCPDVPGAAGFKLDKFTRDEAAIMTGITKVAALPTGCLLIDLRIFDLLAPPWFYYEFSDPPFNTSLASTEDVVFTRNVGWLGIPQYCTWDSWAGHAKAFTVGKPRLSPVDEVPATVWDAFKKGWKPKFDLSSPSTA